MQHTGGKIKYIGGNEGHEVMLEEEIGGREKDGGREKKGSG